MGHEFFTNEELKSWKSWMDSPASPPLSPSGVKKFTPDYENLDRDKAIEDFRERIKHYEDSYEPLSIEKEGLVGFTVISPSNHFATKKSPLHQRIVCLHSISYLTLGTRGFSRVRREFSVLAEGRSHERRSGEARVTIKTWQKPETALEKSLAPRVYLSRIFTFSPMRIWCRAKYKSVDPLLMILVSNFIPNAENRFG